MLRPKYSKKFKKDIKKFEHQKAIMQAIREVIHCLLKQKALEERHCDHRLSGNWIDHRECHVKPDILLIYKTDNENLFLERVGTHSELFNKNQSISNLLKTFWRALPAKATALSG